MDLDDSFSVDRDGVDYKIIRFRVKLLDAVSQFFDRLFSPVRVAKIWRHDSPGPFDRSLVRNILVVDPYAIGDLVLTSALLREIRQAFPDAYIRLLIQPINKALLKNCPYVNDIVVMDVGLLNLFSAQWLEFLKGFVLAKMRLNDRSFDLASFAHWCIDNPYVSSAIYFSKARWRFGFLGPGDTLSGGDRKKFSTFYTNLIEQPEVHHEAGRKLSLVEFTGGEIKSKALEIWTDEKDELYAERTLALGDKEHFLVALGVGTAIPKKRWPEKRYAQLCEWLVDEYNAIILIVGNQDERRFAELVSQKRPGHVINAAGTTTILQCGALLKRCSLYIGNDTSTKHLAAAGQVPVVEISMESKMRQGSPTLPNLVARWGPWETSHRVVNPQNMSAPCTELKDGAHVLCVAKEAHCILEVSLEDVKQSIRELIAECKLV